jgi:hypothetical protein
MYYTIILCYITLCCTILYYIILYYIILYYTRLYHVYSMYNTCNICNSQSANPSHSILLHCYHKLGHVLKNSRRDVTQSHDLTAVWGNCTQLQIDKTLRPLKGPHCTCRQLTAGYRHSNILCTRGVQHIRYGSCWTNYDRDGSTKAFLCVCAGLRRQCGVLCSTAWRSEFCTVNWQGEGLRNTTTQQEQPVSEPDLNPGFPVLAGCT